jgi:hypothetical protein
MEEFYKYKPMINFRREFMPRTCQSFQKIQVMCLNAHTLLGEEEDEDEGGGGDTDNFCKGNIRHLTYRKYSKCKKC